MVMEECISSKLTSIYDIIAVPARCPVPSADAALVQDLPLVDHAAAGAVGLGQVQHGEVAAQAAGGTAQLEFYNRDLQ